MACPQRAFHQEPCPELIRVHRDGACCLQEGSGLQQEHRQRAALHWWQGFVRRGNPADVRREFQTARIRWRQGFQARQEFLLLVPVPRWPAALHQLQA